MKEGIHPDYHEITVVMTDGTSYKTRSTYGKAGDTLRLEIDSKSHPAWTGGQQRLLDTGGQLARFNKRFGGFGPKAERHPGESRDRGRHWSRPSPTRSNPGKHPRPWRRRQDRRKDEFLVGLLRDLRLFC